MAGVSLNNLAKQVQLKTGKGDTQSIIRALLNAYGSVAEKSYYVNKKDDNGTLDGSFMQIYDNLPILNDGKFYTTFPSTFALLPHAFGIKTVDFTGGSSPFLYVNNFSMFSGLKSESMGGLFVYQPSGMKCYFPNMPASAIQGQNNIPKTIMMELACAYDGIDVDEAINISGNMANELVAIVIQLYAPTVPPPVNEAIK